jgi:CoA:oxalate CoA-transferase
MLRKPLHGVRVIDFTHALAGPFCTHHLTLMGADVIKVEPPGGEDFRERPGAFYAANASKRSITINLRAEGARSVMERLVAGADVVVENFRPGVASRLGLEWLRLKQLNPRLIFCSISGFGQDGELKHMPAIESSVQAASGLLAAQVADSDHPRKTPMLLLDPLTGYVAYAAILAALLQRDKTGIGQRVDVAMADVALMISSIAVANAQLEFAAPTHLSERAGMIGRPTVGRFQAQDRSLFISAVQSAWWERVCDLIDRPELKSDSRFATSEARFDNADALMVEWSAALAARPAAEWERVLADAGVPAAMVRTLQEFASHPHVVQRGTLSEVSVGETGERIRLVGAGVKFEHGGPGFSSEVPALGAHTDEVLREFGYTDVEIGLLRAQKVI